MDTESHQTNSYTTASNQENLTKDFNIFSSNSSKGSKDGNKKTSFFFRKRNERINWRLVSSIDLNQLLRNVDIQLLQDVLENLTFSDIMAEDFRHSDPNLVKLFSLSQLIIEYLLYSQDYLNQSKTDIEDKLSKSAIEFSKITKATQKLKDEVTSLKKENRALRKTVYAYQWMSKLPGASQSQAVMQPSENAVKCDYCNKIFQGEQFLESHIQRRHPESIAQIKVTTNTSANQPQNNPKSIQEDINATLAEALDKFNSKISAIEKETKENWNIRLQSALDEHEEHLTRKYDLEKEKYEFEIKTLKDKLKSEIDQQLSKFENAVPQKSNVGDVLEDDHEIAKEVEGKMNEKFENMQNATVSTIKDMLQKEISQMKDSLLNEERAQIQKLADERKSLDAYLAESKSKIQELSVVIDEVKKAEPNISKFKSPTEESYIETPISVKEKLKDSPDYDYNEELSPKSPQSFQQRRTSRPEFVDNQAIDDPDWLDMLDIMESYNHNPISDNPWIRSKFAQPMSEIETQRDIVSDMLDEILLQRGITIEVMRNEDAVQSKLKQLREDRAIVSDKYPCFMWMKDYIKNTLDAIEQEEFVYDPKKNVPIVESQQEKYPKPVTIIKKNYVGPSHKSRRSSIRSSNYSKMLKPRPPSKPRTSNSVRSYRQSGRTRALSGTRSDGASPVRNRSISMRSNRTNSSAADYKESDESSYDTGSEDKLADDIDDDEGSEEEDDEDIAEYRKEVRKIRDKRKASSPEKKTKRGFSFRAPYPVETARKRRRHHSHSSYLDKPKETIKKGFDYVKGFFRRKSGSGEDYYSDEYSDEEYSQDEEDEDEVKSPKRVIRKSKRSSSSNSHKRTVSSKSEPKEKSTTPKKNRPKISDPILMSSTRTESSSSIKKPRAVSRSSRNSNEKSKAQRKEEQADSDDFELSELSDEDSPRRSKNDSKTTKAPSLVSRKEVRRETSSGFSKKEPKIATSSSSKEAVKEELKENKKDGKKEPVKENPVKQDIVTVLDHEKEDDDAPNTNTDGHDLDTENLDDLLEEFGTDDEDDNNRK